MNKWIIVRKHKYVSFGFNISSFVLWTLIIDFWHWSIAIRLGSHKPN